MKILTLILTFLGNLVYLSYMTFIEGEDFDFDFLPFGKDDTSETNIIESLVFFP